jgi:capsular exopolysaccharide synthesis family protein
MAESGKRVLFIDADLRKSVLLGRLKAESAVLGLTHYLTGQKELEEVLYTTNLKHPDIIFTGPVPPNPSELLNSNMFRELILKLKEVYDYIIIDTPPLGAVIDSAIVASCCDGVILVVQSNAISHKFAKDIVKQLKIGNCKILGAILNKVDLKNNKYYGKYHGNY